jgi:predicted secreted acid phosphatase
MRTRAKLALAVVLLLVGAVPALAATAPTGKTADQINTYYSSGLWRKAVKKQVTRAKGYIIKRTEGLHKAHKPALVLDIDETSLNNYPCFKAKGGIPYDALVNVQCVLAFNAPRVPAVHSLFIFAKQHGVKVFFITARPEQIKDGTLQNLRSAGYKGRYEVFLQPQSYTQDSKVPYKSGARAQIEQRGFDIIANVGDQQSDLAGGHAERTFKLPNPIYLTS